MAKRNAGAERERLAQARDAGVPWRKWGPYLSERQWGTVREDYSAGGDAWDSFPHDHARSRAYHWGEDGLAGISDEQSRLCFALALWNERDPILKERLFGLTNGEGNHGEDVKEYYFYLDSTPTHSYMRWLYKYPQRAYPYADLLETNRRRSRLELEYELLDTGIFDEDRYFDVVVEYAKSAPEDLLIRITATNRGPDPAPLHLLPTLWFRNTWQWWTTPAKPELRETAGRRGTRVVAAAHAEIGPRWLHVEGDAPLLFTENETNHFKLFGGRNASAFVKDGIDDFVVRGRADAVNPEGHGTKVAAHHHFEVGPGESVSLRLRLTDSAPRAAMDPFARFDETFAARHAEADELYASITPAGATEDEARVVRQALAGMLWSKQYYFFDLDTWLEEHGGHPLLGGKQTAQRNRDWFHMVNGHVISMPDKWEYPWYAAWDLAFHALALALVDVDFAKQQLDLMLQEDYLHPSGQIPAYEWNFGDVNPPVHAWATWYVYTSERDAEGKGDLVFLERSFQKLLLNFTWWVNRKDPTGKNVFEGGFLGLDNIGVFDRSAPLPTGGRLEQADGTAWMAFFSLNMLDIALELARHNPLYADMASKFVQHFLQIAAAMDRIGDNDDEMWDEQDGFFYDLLRLPDGGAMRMKLRSMVGLLPLCATTVFPGGALDVVPGLRDRVRAYAARHPELTQNISPPEREGAGGRRMLSILDERKLRRVLTRVLDENEFLGPYGIRALSRAHLDDPFVFRYGGHEHRVTYLPAESDSGMFGGNSNWRGPVWMPVNALLIRALLSFHTFYGDDFRIECPTGSGREMNLFEVARELARRLSATFLRDESGRRPVYGGTEKFQTDPHWKDHLLFYEYFHGDLGAGIGASHQTGWTGLVAVFLELFGRVDGERLLASGRAAAFDRAAGARGRKETK